MMTTALEPSLGGNGIGNARWVNAAAEAPGAVFLSSSVIFLVLVLCRPTRLPAQTVLPADKTAMQVADSIGLPKPAMAPTAGTWKYKETDVVREDTYHSTFSVTIKDDGGVWTVTSAMKSSLGPVTDVATLEKGTLILRKESFTHFLHKDQPWKPVAINVDFSGNKVTGVMKYVNGPDKPVAMDLGGPVFAEIASTDVKIGCLPLADGYSATFRFFEIDRVPIDPPAANKMLQLKVVGTERVTVPAGTFDSYKVELTSAEGYKGIVWIAKDSRIPVRTYYVEVYRKGSVFTTTELVP